MTGDSPPHQLRPMLKVRLLLMRALMGLTVGPYLYYKDPVFLGQIVTISSSIIILAIGTHCNKSHPKPLILLHPYQACT